MKKAIVFAFALLFALSGCARQTEPKEPPDLTGTWHQVGEEGTFYQIATITEDTIETYWYLVEDESTYLYWTGSFTPPETGDEPYSWQSVNDLEKALTSNWAMRDEVKTFTYQDGRISYIVTMGNLRMSVALERDEQDE